MELELNDRFAFAGTDEEANYIGIERRQLEMTMKVQKMFGFVSEDMGILGHRLNWAKQGL